MSNEFLDETREPYRFANIEQFTAGKNPPKNEDAVAYTDTLLVLSDGATDKSGQSFEGRSGGEIASELVVDVCTRSQSSGVALVAEVTKALGNFYEKNNPRALTDSAFRFAATMVAARVVDDQLVVTQVGDSSFRINGTDIYTNNKIVDDLTAGARKQYIQATGDVAGSRDFIMPILKTQHQYQNNPTSPLGYGVIDGTEVPEQYIKTYTFPADAVQTIELVSDGYYGTFPAEASIAGYEELHAHIEQVDPNKCEQYPSTKMSDDRTVLIASLQ